MLVSNLLDVALSMVLIYLILSIICTAINGWVARGLSPSSRNLAQGVQSLLAGLQTPNGQLIAHSVYNHEMIKCVSAQGPLSKMLKRESHPSYISAATFASTLMDVVASASTQGVPMTFDLMREGLARLQPNETQQRLLSLVNQAEGDLTQAQQNIEQWFNQHMEYVSDWYKGKMQIVTLVVALVVTLGVNADTVHIFDVLWHDSAVRAAVTTAAQEAVKTTAPAGTSDATRVAQAQRELERLNIPLGWVEPYFPNTVMGIVGKLVGWLLTTAAVSLGAPFWFDALKAVYRARESTRSASDSDEK
jgi:hypothetical protein